MERSTLILSVLYQFSGPFSGVPFLCFRIFTPVKLGHTWDSPFLIFPQDCAAPSLFLFNIQLQPCTGLFLLPSQNKNREKKEKKSFHRWLSSQPHFAMAFISVSLESLSMCLHPPPFFHLQDLRRPAQESLGLHLIGIPPASQPLPHHLPIWPRCSQLKYLLSPRELIPCSSASIFLQSWSFSIGPLL